MIPSGYTHQLHGNAGLLQRSLHFFGLAVGHGSVSISVNRQEGWIVCRYVRHGSGITIALRIDSGRR